MTVIQTDEARCKDCYGCVKACPVIAMSIKAGHVQRSEERCIACASCVRACTQQARTVRNDVPLVKDALAGGRHVVASLSPWLPAFLPFSSFDQAKQSLLGLGFADVFDTSLGAVMVGAEHSRLAHDSEGLAPLLTSSCPGIVHLIERHHPDMIPHLAPVVSPMIAHSRWLKSALGQDAFVVFIGPCVAAKLEAADEAVAGAVDVVLTFTELAEWLQAAAIEVPRAEPLDTAGATALPLRFFPVVGALRCMDHWETDILRKRILTTSGVDSCLHVLESLRTGQLEVDLVEMMLCSGGCMNGPSERAAEDPLILCRRVMAYAEHSLPTAMPSRTTWPTLERVYVNKSAEEPSLPGLPGQTGSRDQGHRETESQAREIARVVMDLTPNIIIAVDSSLRVVAMSPSAERAFGCDLSIVRGHPLSDFVYPTDDFVRAWKESRAVVKSKVRYRSDLIVEQTVVPAIREKALVAIMRDITAEENRREELSQLAQETIARTHEVLNFQMQVAHEIASLLGETTAESKIQLGRLIQLVQGLEWLDVA